MDTERAEQSWIEPIALTFAMLLPGLMPANAPQSLTIEYMASGAAQSLSQFILLIVIIGAQGRLREHGIVGPKAADVLKALGLFAIAVLVARISLIAGSRLGLRQPMAIAFVETGARGPVVFIIAAAFFSMAVAYREELFYRLYILGELRLRGARQGPAILVSALLFAAGHAYQGPQGMFSSLMFGVLMAIAATRGLNVHALALAHAAYDFGVLSLAMIASAP